MHKSMRTNRICNQCMVQYLPSLYCNAVFARTTMHTYVSLAHAHCQWHTQYKETAHSIGVRRFRILGGGGGRGGKV